MRAPEGPSGEAAAVAAALRAAGYANAWDVPVSPRLCSEPIVCRQGAFARSSRQEDGGERGCRAVTVTVCCEDPRDAEATANGVAADLAGVDWARAARPAWLRFVAADVGAPAYLGRDGSGRWLWGMEVRLEEVIDRGQGQGD